MILLHNSILVLSPIRARVDTAAAVLWHTIIIPTPYTTQNWYIWFKTCNVHAVCACLSCSEKRVERCSDKLEKCLKTGRKHRYGAEWYIRTLSGSKLIWSTRFAAPCCKIIKIRDTTSNVIEISEKHSKIDCTRIDVLRSRMLKQKLLVSCFIRIWSENW